jgi:leucyl aminopeptidase
MTYFPLGAAPAPAVAVRFAAAVPAASAALARIVASGRARERGDAYADPPWGLTVAVPLAETATPDQARKAGALAAAALFGEEVEEAALTVALPPEAAAAFARGFRARAFRPLSLKVAPKAADRWTVRTLTIAATDPAASAAAWTVWEAIAEGTEWARSLAAEPGNRLTPATFAQRLAEFAELGVEVEVLEEGALAREGLNLHLAVGRGSTVPPRLVLLRWRGGAKNAAPTLLVGKGLTFDAGGICLKKAANMEDMRGDMAGAAAVAGAVRALARLKAPVNVTAALPLAENMPGPDAQRPGDVWVSHSGKTVEVIDTDAEGRLVLADALSYACAADKPARAAMLSTLTYAIMTALGGHYAGLFATHEELAQDLLAASAASGEKLWRMPFTPPGDPALRSEIADLRNYPMPTSPMPDAMNAAAFLRAFVPDGVPFAHLDIAAMTLRNEPTTELAAGPTGFGVACLVTWLLA